MPVIGIEVNVSDGIVKLMGTVNNLAAKKYAGLEAAKINGVRGVINEISVDVPFRCDFDIAQDVLQRILNSSSIKTRNIDVKVSDGMVILSGSVTSSAEADQAQLLTTETKGVKSVSNNLVVTYPSERSDSDIRNDVQSALTRDVYLTGLPISVSVKDGVVTLTGEVNSLWDKNHAYDVVSRIAGVRGVINNIKVNYCSEYTDASIRERIQDRLAANAETRWIADDIKVTVSSGKVTLSGTVNYWSEYDAAENAALDTNGVWAVVNQLNVRDYDYWPPPLRE